MANTISEQAHLDPRLLRQHNNKHIEQLQKIPAGGQQEGASDKVTQQTDTVTITHTVETNMTYASSLTLQEAKNDGYDLLRALVVNMLKEQGIDFKVANGDEEYDISELSQEKAQELIADDGYFGVEQTSDRIVDFAISLAGGDQSRLAVIKEGVEKGFNEALEAFGGWLPDISYETYDAVFAKLDAWAEQSAVDPESE